MSAAKAGWEAVQKDWKERGDDLIDWEQVGEDGRQACEERAALYAQGLTVEEAHERTCTCDEKHEFSELHPVHQRSERIFAEAVRKYSAN